MQNHNVFEFKGNVKESIKNGYFNTIILFPEINNDLTKFLDTFTERKEVSDDNTLIKTRSPFRIGIIRFNLLYFKNVLSRKIGYTFDKEVFENYIKNFCREYKNKMALINIPVQLSAHRRDIEKILNDNMHDNKIAILN